MTLVALLHLICPLYSCRRCSYNFVHHPSNIHQHTQHTCSWLSCQIEKETHGATIYTKTFDNNLRHPIHNLQCQFHAYTWYTHDEIENFGCFPLLSYSFLLGLNILTLKLTLGFISWDLHNDLAWSRTPSN